MWVSLDTTKLGMHKDLWIGASYIPPAGSTQLRDTPLDERYQVLLQRVGEATGKGYTMLLGDLNARVGTISDLPDPPPPHVLPTHRLNQDAHINPAGNALVDLCQATGLALLTGRALPDVPAIPTCRMVSRPDHVAVSHDMYSLVASHSVLPDACGSDHNPILTSLTLLHRPAPPARPPTTAMPQQYRFRAECRQAYCQLLQSPEAQAQLGLAMTYTEQLQDVDRAVEVVLAVGKRAAQEAGHRVFNPANSSGGGRRHQPWFDSECAQLYKRLQWSATNRGQQAPVTCSYRARFEKLARKKKKQHALTVAQDLAYMARRNPNAMWKALRDPSLTARPTTMPADPMTCRQHFQSAFQPNAPQVAPPTGAGLGDPTDSPEHVLNAQITCDEVLHALRRQRNNKASGADGLQAEFLKYAHPPAPPGIPTAHLNPFLPSLTSIYNHLLTHSVVPNGWADTLVSLILKKGDPTLWRNYRPIAVAQLLGKIYATILQQRLSNWTESLGLRAPAQTGFRPGHATSHHAFVLQQLIAAQRKRRAGHRRLYVCFVDLEQAYDRVPRELLWSRLHDLGVRGKFLFAVKSLYDAGVNLSIKCGDGLLEPIAASVGVKQGCPLSPLLFGLYIEGLEDHIRATCPDVGPTLGDPAAGMQPIRIPLLMYADDAALVATCPGHLQQLLDSMAQWGLNHGMNINLTKTEIVVFNSNSDPGIGTWFLGASAIAVSKSFKYLGVTFNCLHLDKNMEKAAAQRGRAALAGMKRKLGELNAGGNVGLTLYLYNTLVQPALLYGAEVWGLTCLPNIDPVAVRCDSERFQRIFLRTTMHLRRGTSVWVMYREAGLYPMQYACLKVMLRFAGRVLCLPNREYVVRALRWACTDPHAVDEGSWFGRLKNVVQRVLPQGVLLHDVLNIGAGVVEVDTILQHWRRYHAAVVWGSLPPDPRLAVHHVTRCTYHCWFATPLPADDAEWSRAPCIDCDRIAHKHVLSLIRFRTGNHNLLVDLQRRGHADVPRAARVCTLCTMHAVQDAAHIVFECPFFVGVRQQYGSLFQTHARMPELFTDMHVCLAVGHFVHKHVMPMNRFPQ